MTAVSLIDAFEGFLPIWQAACDKTVERQVELWHAFYESHYPELLEKQLQDYASQGLDWHKVAAERIFPHLKERISRMEEAWQGLQTLCGLVYEQATQALNIELDVVFVIYVGLGCGAGWATRYQGRPACLLGLESIAELGWHTPEKLEGLIAHELGHLIHEAWRGEALEPLEGDPWFQLYSEGFAQRLEHVILGQESWHAAQDESWLTWCREHQADLARAYFTKAERGETVSEFFGSWFEFQGRKQTAYFLGHEFIRWLERERELRELARFSLHEVRQHLRQYLSTVVKRNHPRASQST